MQQTRPEQVLEGRTAFATQREHRASMKFFLFATFIAAAAVAAGATSAARVVTCKPGQKVAIVDRRRVCLYVGRACKLRYQIGYRRAGFTCVPGTLVLVLLHRPPPRYVIVPTVPQLPAPGSRSNPFPLGAEVTFGSTWKITVIGVTPDATAAVLAANQFNDPPAAGHQFFMVTVRETYIGSGSAQFDASFQLRAVGASGVGYTTFDDSSRCGVLPPRDLTIDEPALFTGGSVEGNECWSVASSDAPSLEMYVDSNPPTFFALH